MQKYIEILSLFFVFVLLPMNSLGESNIESDLHRSFRKPKVVSVWLGNIDSKLLDEYLAEGFSKDFGFDIYPPAGPEADASENSKPVFELLDGFSQFKLFQKPATELAKSKGWEKASAVIIFYHFAFEPEKVKVNPKAKMSFIGVVPFLEKEGG